MMSRAGCVCLMTELIASAMTETELNVGITTDTVLPRCEQREPTVSHVRDERSKDLLHLPSIAAVAELRDCPPPSGRAHFHAQRCCAGQFMQAPREPVG